MTRGLLAAERSRLLVEILEQEGSLSVAGAARRLGVSPSTVRRDVSRLQRRGLLARVYGGAVAGSGPAPEPAPGREAEKGRIGKAAALTLRDGETVLIGGGTTTAAMVAQIGRTDLTVVTNDLRTALAAGRRPGVSVVVLGGYLRQESVLDGHIAVQSLVGLNLDRAYVGAYGIDAEGLMGASLSDTETERALIAAAPELTVLADSSKFGRRGPARLARPPQMAAIVTDSGAPGPVLQALSDRGVRVVVC